MSVTFRDAMQDDLPAIIALLQDDHLGASRESDDMAPYLAAFDEIRAQGGNAIVVGEEDGRIVATFQLTVIAGLSLRATRRAQVESVRVAADLRGRGIGAAMMAEAERRAREAGSTLVQLTSNATRTRARRFYESLGYEASHTGFKKPLAP